MVGIMLAASALIAALALIGATSVFAVRAFRVPPAHSDPRTDDVTALHARVKELEIAVQGLPSLWESERQRMEEQRERAERAYASARASWSRARRQREGSDEGEDEEDGDLSAWDGAASAGEGVPTMSPGMGRREALAAIRAKARERRL